MRVFANGETASFHYFTMEMDLTKTVCYPVMIENTLRFENHSGTVYHRENTGVQSNSEWDNEVKCFVNGDDSEHLNYLVRVYFEEYISSTLDTFQMTENEELDED